MGGHLELVEVPKRGSIADFAIDEFLCDCLNWFMNQQRLHDFLRIRHCRPLSYFAIKTHRGAIVHDIFVVSG